MASLGKGLESLIPPNQKKGDVSSAAPGQPAPPQSTPPPLGGRPVAHPTPAAPPHLSLEELEAMDELAASPAEEILPPSDLINPERELASKPQQQVPKSDFAAPGQAILEPEVTARQRSKENQAIFYIEVAKIKPNKDQPRHHFDEESIRELAASIREFGILQPLVVTKKETDIPGGTEVEYELIAGERRLMASKLLGMERVPVIVRYMDLERERLELGIIENIQRENLNGIEMARAFSRLQDEFRLTQREIAARLGKSRETVANTLRLLDLPTYIQDALEKNQISDSHGRFLLTIDDPAAQQSLFHELLNGNLTIRELRHKARAFKKSSEPQARTSPDLKMFEERLSSELGTPVSIHQKGESGRITINFYSEEELRGIIQRLAKEEE